MACKCKTKKAGCGCKSVASILKLGRSQGDVGTECPDGYALNQVTGECVSIGITKAQKCPIGYQWHVTQGCIPARQAPIENSPTQTPVDSRYGVNGEKPLRTSVCNGVVAPNGYHYIKTANGCSLAVNYDGNVVTQPTTTNNPLTNLLTSLFGGGATATSGGVSGGGVSGFIEQNKTLLLLAVLGGGAYMLSKGKKPTPKTYDETRSYKY